MNDRRERDEDGMNDEKVKRVPDARTVTFVGFRRNGFSLPELRHSRLIQVPVDRFGYS